MEVVANIPSDVIVSGLAMSGIYYTWCIWLTSKDCRSTRSETVCELYAFPVLLCIAQVAFDHIPYVMSIIFARQY